MKLHTISEKETEKLKKRFGKSLKRARRSAGYKSQEMFSEMIGRDLKTIQNWEQGRIMPKVETLLGLSEFLNVDLDYLIGRLDYKSHDNKAICQRTGLSEAAVEKLQQLPSDYMRILSLLIEDLDFEYLLSLMTKRVANDPAQTRPKDRQPTHKELTQDDMFIEIDGQRILTKQYNILDSLITSEIMQIVKVMGDRYHNRW